MFGGCTFSTSLAVCSASLCVVPGGALPSCALPGCAQTPSHCCVGRPVVKPIHFSHIRTPPQKHIHSSPCLNQQWSHSILHWICQWSLLSNPQPMTHSTPSFPWAAQLQRSNNTCLVCIPGIHSLLNKRYGVFVQMFQLHPSTPTLNTTTRSLSVLEKSSKMKMLHCTR